MTREGCDGELMGEFIVDDERDFQRLLNAAREIVLPGASGIRLPEQRPGGAWYDVTNDCIMLTDDIPAYGSC